MTTTETLTNKAPPEAKPPLSQWGSEFYDARDLYTFVKRAAVEAINNNDGRAAYYVAESLKTCASARHQFERDPDFIQNFDLNYAKVAPKAPEWVRAKARRDFDRCAQLAKEDPFSDLPARDGGYRSPGYWNDMALSNNDPVAAAHQAYADLADANYGNADSRGPKIHEAQQLVYSASLSGDPAAIFMAGQVIANSHIAENPVRGIALSLAACELGYDCSSRNAANSFSSCRDNGSCPADADYFYYMQQALGQADYADAYSQAQTFKELMARNDVIGLREFVRFDKSTAQ